MTVKELVDALGLEILSMPDGDREITGGYAGDLLSWVMGRARAGDAWATIMTNVNVLAVATLADTSVTVICEDSAVPDEVVSTASEKGINLVRTGMSVYGFCAALSERLK